MRHPEELAVVEGLEPKASLLELGGGGNPTPWAGRYVSLDLVGAGQLGFAGSQCGVVSTAQVAGSIHQLPFAGHSFDAVVGRHVLEHHPDTVAVLSEVARVLKPGGEARLVVPDQSTYFGNTVHLDPTHRAAFTPEQLATLAGYFFREVSWSPVIPEWSFIVKGRK